MRALYKAPKWFTAPQKRIYDLMNSPEGHERGMRQNDGFGAAYRRGFADQDRRHCRYYTRSSLAYAAYRAGCDYGLATRPMTN